MDSKVPMSIAPAVWSNNSAADIAPVAKRRYQYAVGVRESTCNTSGLFKYSRERGLQTPFTSISSIKVVPHHFQFYKPNIRLPLVSWGADERSHRWRIQRSSPESLKDSSSRCLQWWMPFWAIFPIKIRELIGNHMTCDGRNRHNIANWRHPEIIEYFVAMSDSLLVPVDLEFIDPHNFESVCSKAERLVLQSY